jgi:iron complex outermembrane receptor protein
MKAGGTAGRIGYLLNLSRVETDGFRTHSHSEIRQGNLALNAQLAPNTDIRGIFNFFDMPFGESSSSLTLADALNNPKSVRPQAIEQGWGEASRQGQGGVTLEHRLGGGQLFRATGWAMWRDVFNPIPSRIIDLDRTGAGFRSEYVAQHRIGSLPVEWTAGFDLSYQKDLRTEFVNAGVPPGGNRTVAGAQLLGQLEDVLSVAPFVQVSVALRPRWLLTAGARYDYYDFNAADRFLADGDQSGGRKMSAASPKVGLTYLATDWLDLYANFSTAYQTPTTVELSNRPTGEGGFNQDLEPADLRSFELGARGLVRPWRLRYEIAAYRANLDNAFVSFQRPDEQVFFRNAGESTRNGTELLLEWTPVSRVTTRLAYTFQDFQFKRFATDRADFSGKTEPGAPPHQLFLGGSYETFFGLRSTAQLRWVDAYPVNNENTAFNWAYRVVDLRFGLDRHWKGLKVRPFLGIDNVFDVRYNASTTLNAAGARFYEPAPGRELYVGLRIGAAR